MITINLSGLDSLQAASAQAKLLVFDAIGNFVYTKQSNRGFLIDAGLLDDLQDSLSVSVCFYWPGVAMRGDGGAVKAAPGVYKIIVYIEADGANPRKFQQNVAVGRGKPELCVPVSRKSGCLGSRGAGY